MAISTEPKIIVSPSETTTYRLKITTQSGMTDFTDIIVYVKDVLELRFDYSTGNIIDQNNNVILTKNQALARNWVANGNSVLTLNNFTQSNPHFDVANKGGLVFRSECYIPDNSNTLICGMSLEELKSIALYNNKLVIDNIEYSFLSTSYISFEMSIVYDTSISKWKFKCLAKNSLTNEVLVDKESPVDIGVFDSYLFLYFIDNTTAKEGFYFGSDSKPVPYLIRNHLSVKDGTKVTLDSSSSYDPDGSNVSFSWGSKAYNGSRYKKLYLYNSIIQTEVTGSKWFKVSVSDLDGTSEKEVIVTTYTSEQIDSGIYRLKATQDDVKELYSYSWKNEDNEVIGTGFDLVVQPKGNETFKCLITELSTGITDLIEIPLQGENRVLHVYDRDNDIYQEIRVYSSHSLMDNYIECKVDGYLGYIGIAEEALNDQRKSILKCKKNNIVYDILKFI